MVKIEHKNLKYTKKSKKSPQNLNKKVKQYIYDQFLKANFKII